MKARYVAFRDLKYKRIRNANVGKLLKEARELLSKVCTNRHPENAEWRSEIIKPYGLKDYRIEIHYIVGTPIKGFIVADFGTGRVMGFNRLRYRIINWESKK